MRTRLLGHALSGILGGLIVLGGVLLFSPSRHNHNNQEAENISEASARLTAYHGASYLPNDFREAAKNSMKTVVHIKTTAAIRQSEFDPFGLFGRGFPFGTRIVPQIGVGSGVIYRKDGFIITNNHVVDIADEVEVTLYDNRKYRATVIGRDEKTDLAVLKIEADDLPAIRIGNSDDVQVGDWVLAVGNPFELTSTVTAGIVSAKGRSLHMRDKDGGLESYIQTDAAVNPGNSGGALVNTRGELIGINTAIASPTGAYAGYSFAIPVNIVTRVADDLIKYGKSRRGRIGVKVSDMDSDLADELHVKVHQGAYIQEVVPGSPAQLAGLLPDDVIVEVNGKEIKDVPELMGIIGESNVGDQLKIVVNRRGKTKEFDVILRE